MARALGLSVPEHVLVTTSGEAEAELGRFSGDRLVVKVCGRGIVHKSDAGGVEIVSNRREAVAAAFERVRARFAGREIAGVLLQDYVAHPSSLGAELLLGMSWTDEFGPVVSLGLGGADAELLSAALEGGRGAATLAAAPRLRPDLDARLRRHPVVRWSTTGRRGRPAAIELDRLCALLETFCDFAAEAMPEAVSSFELNPLLLTERGPMAVDAVLRLGEPLPPPESPRPLAKLRRLLVPGSMAVIGVSRQRNPGRIIVENVLRRGFDRQRLFVIKPDCETLAGCRCVSDLARLPAPVDLLAVSIEAARVPDLVAEVLRTRRAESLILIPGGLGERGGSEIHERRIRDSIRGARATAWRGPVVNGGNCLGVRSLPGRYDTLFIPEHKLRYPDVDPAPFAFVSQSGAFAVARASKLAALNPRYVVSIGNQIDLTAADYLEVLSEDPEVEVFAFYIEGFRPGDGLRFLEGARRLTASGRSVLLYRAGRTAAGSATAAAHTESIAGDYAVTRDLADAAGVLVVEDLADFEDLVRMVLGLRSKRLDGRRLGAVSNAGFECVAIADRLGSLEAAAFDQTTTERLDALLRRHRLETVVGVRNPLDLTPILADAGFEEAVRTVLADAGVDLAIVGCVPLTGALQTLPPRADHDEDVARPEALGGRLTRLWRESEKAWIAVVDGGPDYDDMARLLEEAGVPTFRSADRALALLEIYCRWRLER